MLEELEKTLDNGSDQDAPKDGVEKSDENSDEGSKQDEKPVAKVVPLEDYEDAYKAIEKVAEERENYKKMAIKWKKLAKDNGVNEEDIEDEEDKKEVNIDDIANKVVEKISPFIKSKSDEEDVVAKTKKRYEELKHSVDNRPSGTSNSNNQSIRDIENKEKPKIPVATQQILKQKAERIGMPYAELEKIYLKNVGNN